MGIDIGYIDLVCQIGSTGSIANFLQRVGRAGHSLGKVPKGRLFPLTRDELLESLALVRAVHRGHLDAHCHSRRAAGYPGAADCGRRRVRRLERRRPVHAGAASVAVSSARAGRLRRHRAHRQRWCGPRHEARGLLASRPHWRPAARRRGARLAAVTSGGAIPDTALYRVVAEPDDTFVGTVDEDFAIESLAGDVFLLGNTSWRVLYVRGGEVRVRDAEGAPPSVPFWLGERPAARRSYRPSCRTCAGRWPKRFRSVLTPATMAMQRRAICSRPVG